jgi:hypothetical protein
VIGRGAKAQKVINPVEIDDRRNILLRVVSVSAGDLCIFSVVADLVVIVEFGKLPACSLRLLSSNLFWPTDGRKDVSIESCFQVRYELGMNPSLIVKTRENARIRKA